MVSWRKVELVFKQVNKEDANSIVFNHSAKDNKFWKGHYGPKMAGSLVKILFNTMEQPECLCHAPKVLPLFNEKQ